MVTEVSGIDIDTIAESVGVTVLVVLTVVVTVAVVSEPGRVSLRVEEVTKVMFEPSVVAAGSDSGADEAGSEEASGPGIGEIVVKMEPGETVGAGNGGARGGAVEFDAAGAGGADPRVAGAGAADPGGAGADCAGAGVAEADAAGAEEFEADCPVAGVAGCSASLANCAGTAAFSTGWPWMNPPLAAF
jgi:hypothetical protein